MKQNSFEQFSVVSNILDVATKVVLAAAGDDYAIRPEDVVREDVATEINNQVRGA